MTKIHMLYQTIRDDDGEEVEALRWESYNLHDAVKDLGATRTIQVGGVEYTGANYQPWNNTLLLTVQNSMEYRTGLREERMLAIPDITRASARRLARLLNAEWSA